MNNVDRFFVVYREELLRIVSAPDRGGYAYGPESVERVAAKMQAAAISGAFNHDGAAFRAACRRLGIKHTRTAILAYCRSAP